MNTLDGYRSLEQLDRRLRARGYRAGRPDPWQVTMDEQICSLSICQFCRRKGMMYWPYLKQEAYRYVGECVSCGHAVEVGVEGHAAEPIDWRPRQMIGS
jgi:hypothetical protein